MHSVIAGEANSTTGSLHMSFMHKLPVVPICRRRADLRRRANHDDISAHPASSKRGVRVVTIRGVREAVDVEATADGWRYHGQSSRVVLASRR
jgi:hypothetical protein